MKKLTKILSVAMASAMMLSMTACGGGGSTGSGGGGSSSGLKLKVNENATKEIVFEYLLAGFGNDPYYAVANAYMERNPDVQIMPYGNKDIRGTAQNNVASGTGVSDIYCYPDDSIKMWIKDGLLEDLSSLCQQETLDGRTMYDSMTGTAAQAISANGKTYAIPEYTSVTGLVYNQDLFEEHGWTVPQTTKELEELCKEIIDAGITPITWCKEAEGYLYFATENWISQYAGVENMEKFYSYESAEIYALEDNDAGSLYTAKKLALQNLVKFFTPMKEGGYAADDSRTVSYTNAQLSILEGDVAMMLNGSWFYNEMKGVWMDERVGIFPMPEITDDQGNILRDADNPVSNGRVMAADYGAYYFIPTNAPDKETAKDFLLYLSSKEACEIYTQYANTIRPFDYDVSSTTELYSNISNFGKSVLEMADSCVLYAPVSNSPLDLKGKAGLWPRGRREESEIMKKGSDTNPDYWLSQDYSFAKANWKDWI